MRYSFAAAAFILMTIPSAAAFAQQQAAGEYLKKAAAGDLYEKQSSELALANSKNREVQTFARQMIADHDKSTADLAASAKLAGIKPASAELEPKHIGMLAELRKLVDEPFDRAYLDQQRKAHAEALALHRDYAAKGEMPPLRQTAANIVPVVEHHLTMLEKDIRDEFPEHDRSGNSARPQ